MRTTETIEGLIRERGKKGEPLERVYRLLYNPELYLSAYGKIYRNQGATTPGITEETVDGMSQEKIRIIIEHVRNETYVWMPAKRVYIPKKNGKKRPLGLPTWSDKLLQEVMRAILEAYYEPQFSDHSHGFRPERGCHTALREIWGKWTGAIWFIEGDISGCFDNINHDALLDILREKIHDERFIRLISNMLNAGYMEEWKFNATLSGTPQGGVISPILSNIYLHKLDEYVETQLIPKRTSGEKRRRNQEYDHLISRAGHLRSKGNREEAKALKQQAMQLPSMDTNDPDFRRLKYVRYADDFLLGFIGTKAEAEQIKEEIGTFLQDTLKLEMSKAKTLVTHARTEAAHFLGYEMHTLQENSQRGGDKRRSLNGKIGLRVPKNVVEEKRQKYMSNGKPKHRPELMEDNDFTIMAIYQAEYRGIVEYYRMAYNLTSLDKLKWVMERSLVMTLANKFKTTVSRTYRKYRANIETKGKTYKGLQVVRERPGKKPLVAAWGGISLVWTLKAQLNDQPQPIHSGRTELVQRLLADECEWCGSTKNVQVHHIRALKDLNNHKGKEKPEWMKLMSARRRKTMVVCLECHQDITAGRPIQRAPSGQGFMQNPKEWHRSQKRT
jgi:group II intron reverse transcriptase/maturase